MTPRSIVAVIMALTVLAFIVISGAIKYNGGAGVADSEAAIEAWKVILAALIGGLTAYIAGGDDK